MCCAGRRSVVELIKLAGDPVDVYVNDRHVARGEVLVLNDNFCVRINGSHGKVTEAVTRSWTSIGGRRRTVAERSRMATPITTTLGKWTGSSRAQQVATALAIGVRGARTVRGRFSQRRSFQPLRRRARRREKVRAEGQGAVFVPPWRRPRASWMWRTLRGTSPARFSGRRADARGDPVMR